MFLQTVDLILPRDLDSTNGHCLWWDASTGVDTSYGNFPFGRKWQRGEDWGEGCDFCPIKGYYRTIVRACNVQLNRARWSFDLLLVSITCHI